MKKIITKYKYVVLVILGFFPLVWFVKYPTAIIDGLDTNFPLDPIVWFVRRLYIWNDVLNGGLHFSSSVAGLFFHFLQVLPYVLGISLQIVELSNILFWSLSIIFASYFFARVFVSKRFVIQLLFVALYSFNIYLFNTWENIKVANLSLMVGLPLLASILKLSVEKKISWKKTIFFSTLVGVVSAGTGINPAYFICLLAGVGIYLLVLLAVKQDRNETLRRSSVVFIPFILVNAFWITPLVDFLFISNTVQTLESIGFTNWVASLSVNTSLLNVIRLQGAWDWYIKNDYGVPLYIPYASRYFYSTPFVLFSFVTPMLAFAAFAYRKVEKMEQYLFFSVLTILGVFLGAGLHEPTGVLFNFLLHNLPFFSFFRSPWYIFTPFTIIGLAGLSGLFVEGLFERFETKKIYRMFYFKHVLVIVTASLVVGQLVYSYPQITGKIFRPGRDDSFYQTFPDYVFEAKALLSKSDYGRIVTYPDDQLESFKWGYKGTESILGLFSSKEVIAPSFNYPNQYLSTLVERFYSSLKRGEFVTAFEMSHILGVDSMFVKTDTVSLAPNILLELARFTQERIDIKDWHFMKIKPEYATTKFQIPKYIYSTDLTPVRLADLSRFISKDSVLVSNSDSQLALFPEMHDKIALISQGKQADISSKDTLQFTYTTKNPEEYTLYLTGYKINPSELVISVDNVPVPPRSVSTSENVIIVSLAKAVMGEHTLTVKLPQSSANILQTAEVSVIGSPTIGTLKYFPVDNFDPFRKYEVSFEFKYDYGDLPSIRVAQSGPNSPYKIEPINLIRNPDWLSEKFIFSPIELASKLELIIQQPIQKAFTSRSTFRNIQISNITENKLYIIEKAKPIRTDETTLTYVKQNPTKYELEVKNAPDGYFIEMKEGYHKGWGIASNDYIGGKQVHMTANGYANLWYVPVGGDANIQVSFFGQKLYVLGLLISGFVLLITFTFFIYEQKRNK